MLQALPKITGILLQQLYKYIRFVFCKGNIEIIDNITYLPWYMIMFYKPKELPQQLIYEIDLSALQPNS